MKKKNIKWLMLIALGIFPLSLLAQTRCPVGVQAGSAQCLPDNEESSPPRPTGEWIKTWGALGGSNQMQNSWSSTGKLTEDAARQDVLNRCHSTGATDCKVDITYFNQCVAVAVATPDSDFSVYFDTGKNEGIAGERALSDCRKKFGSKCSVKFTECSDPIFRKY